MALSYVSPSTGYARPFLARENAAVPQGRDGRTLVDMMITLDQHWTERPSLAARSASVPLLNLDDSDDEFRAYLAKDGLEMRALLADAGRCFDLPHPVRTAPPLTAEQRRTLADDDLRGISS